VRINENEPGDKPDKHFRKTGDGKQILRDAMRNFIPEDILSATKQGFSAPDASWFKGESIDYVKKSLYGNNARIYEFLDRNTVKSLLDEHLEGKHNRRLLIWSLLNLEHLLDTLDFNA
jgi:asparagine synthase (glutamine-hydrolysing)